MKTITQEQLNQIIPYLESVTVPAGVGANLIAIANLLKNLPDVKDEKKKDDKKTTV